VRIVVAEVRAAAADAVLIANHLLKPAEEIAWRQTDKGISSESRKPHKGILSTMSPPLRGEVERSYA
jgi:hypothetical protein